METFWLLGRKDMAEANDSMVCKFVPRKKKPGDKKKKPPKTKKENRENVSNLKIEEKESSVGKSTTTLNTDSTPSSRKNSIPGFIAHNLGKFIGGSGGTIDQDRGKHGNKRNSLEAGVTALMHSIPLIMGSAGHNLKDNGTGGGKVIPPSNGENVLPESRHAASGEALGNDSQNTGQKFHEVVQMSTAGHDIKEKGNSCDELSDERNENRICIKCVPEIIEPANGPLPVGSQIVRKSGTESTINDIITNPLYQKKSEGQQHQSLIDHIEFSNTVITQEHSTEAKMNLPMGTALNQNFVLSDIGDTATLNNSLPPLATLEDTMHQQVKRSSVVKIPLGSESVGEQERKWTNSEDILSKDTHYPNNKRNINGQVHDRTEPQEETLLTNQEVTVKHCKKLTHEEVSGQNVVSNANSLPFSQAAQFTSASVTQLESGKTMGGIYSYNYSQQEGSMNPIDIRVKDDKGKKYKKITSQGQENNSHFAADVTDC